MRPASNHRQTRTAGMTLIEVMVSIALVTVIVLAALMVRYHAVRHAVRADAYGTAGKLGLMLLEGWRSSGVPSAYNPDTTFAGQITISTSGSGPVAPAGFTLRGCYHVLLDNVNYYPTLAYIDATATHPAQLHVSIGFRNDYQTGTISTGDNVVQLTTYD